MAFDFSADDVFEMAEQLERDGAIFYRKSAELADNEKIRAQLLHLADMEAAHGNLFSALRKDLTAGEKKQRTFDPDNEAVLYLKAMSESRVSFEHELHPGDTLESVLKNAIESEKDTIVFYLGMKDVVTEKAGKEKIDRIIREEMGHVRMLKRILENHLSNGSNN